MAGGWCRGRRVDLDFLIEPRVKPIRKSRSDPGLRSAVFTGELSKSPGAFEATRIGRQIFDWSRQPPRPVLSLTSAGHIDAVPPAEGCPESAESESREPEAKSASSSASRVRSENGASAARPASRRQGQRQYRLPLLRYRRCPTIRRAFRCRACRSSRPTRPDKWCTSWNGWPPAASCAPIARPSYRECPFRQETTRRKSGTVPRSSPRRLAPDSLNTEMQPFAQGPLCAFGSIGHEAGGAVAPAHVGSVEANEVIDAEAVVERGSSARAIAQPAVVAAAHDSPICRPAAPSPARSPRTRRAACRRNCRGRTRLGAPRHRRYGR